MSRAALTDPPAAAGDKLSLRLWLQLMKCTKALEGEVAARLRRAHRQSLARFDVLSQLYRFDGEWVAIGALARRMMATSGNITGLLDRMAAEDLIERRPSPSDRRSFQVRMTAKGRKLFATMTGDHAGWVDAALTGIPDRDKERLIELLIRVRRALESRPPGP